MLVQQMTGRASDMSGRLVIQAPAGDLIPLQELAAELAQRPNMRTQGSIVVVTPQPDPPPPEETLPEQP